MNFVDFDLAKKLKEKGFNLHCMPFYALENFTAEYVDSCGDCYEVDFEKDILYLNYPLCYKKFEEKMLPAPTISQVLKWLREEKKIAINIEFIPHVWQYKIVDMSFEERFEPCGKTFYEKYEQAAFAALEYVLDNLI